MTLPFCHYQIDTFESLPIWHYQIVSVKLSPYQIVIIKLSLSNCHYQIDITKNPPVFETTRIRAIHILVPGKRCV